MRADEIMAVQHYLDHGGQVHPIPFGVSGIEWPGFEMRRYTFTGWAKRTSWVMPEGSYEVMRAGHLTMVQAQVPAVWQLAHDGRSVSTVQVARALAISKGSARRALELLIQKGQAKKFRQGRKVLYRALGSSAPDWKAYVRAPQSLAA